MPRLFPENLFFGQTCLNIPGHDFTIHDTEEKSSPNMVMLHITEKLINPF